jgi:hypothetical protein
MPGKADDRIGARVYVLDNVRFQDVIRHTKRLVLWVEVYLVQVVTVVTVQVADGANWFGKHLKLPGSFGHGAQSATSLDARPVIQQRSSRQTQCDPNARMGERCCTTLILPQFHPIV